MKIHAVHFAPSITQTFYVSSVSVYSSSNHVQYGLTFTLQYLSVLFYETLLRTYYKVSILISYLLRALACLLLASPALPPPKMNLAFDEYGRPFIIIREQRAKERVKGIEAIKVK